MDFEKAIASLENIVQKLNNTDISLDESVKLFEQGVDIVKESYENLEKASGKITMLQKELDKYCEIKFDADNE